MEERICRQERRRIRLFFCGAYSCAAFVRRFNALLLQQRKDRAEFRFREVQLSSIASRTVHGAAVLSSQRPYHRAEIDWIFDPEFTYTEYTLPGDEKRYDAQLRLLGDPENSAAAFLSKYGEELEADGAYGYSETPLLTYDRTKSEGTTRLFPSFASLYGSFGSPFNGALPDQAEP